MKKKTLSIIFKELTLKQITKRFMEGDRVLLHRVRMFFKIGVEIRYEGKSNKNHLC